MTSRRCYRPAFTDEETCRFILEGSGKHFDPDVVAAFEGTRERFQRIWSESRAG